LKRKQLNFLDSWLKSPDRKPLVIRGARQVGKSTLVRLFAAQQTRPLAEVNLERFPELDRVFNTMDVRHIVDQIEALPNIAPLSSDSILFLDEIQNAPNAVAALRYFYEDMKPLPVISAGSLLEFVLSDHRFPMPVGRIQYLHMGPMTFREFLDALGESALAGAIGSYAPGKELGSIVHGRLLKLLRAYYFVGGMPEAVAVYARNRKFSEITAVHTSLIDTYRDDFPKYAGSRNLTRMLGIFNFAARNVGSKVKYSSISKDERSETLRQDIELLCLARVISKVIHTNASGLPLQADLNEKAYKLLFLDVGLMNAISGLSWDALSRMDDIELINKGAVAEQFVGQHLQALSADSPNRELTYWLREGKSSNAEIDFVTAFDGQIVPVEVKSGGRGRLKSLHQFMGEKKLPLAVRFDANLPSEQTVETVIRKEGREVKVRYRLLSLPLYLVERMRDVVREAGVLKAG
jgi:Predicted ATPase (AAA+ superfamily)